MELESSIPKNVKAFLELGFFYFSSQKSFLLKHEKFLKLGSKKFHFSKHKENFFWENVIKFHFPKYKQLFFEKNFLFFWIESSISWNVRKFFFEKAEDIFSKWGFGNNIRNFFQEKILRLGVGKCSRLLHI